MEGKRSPIGSPSSGSSSSLASELFGSSGKSSSSPSSGLFNSVFAPPSSSVGGREPSRSADIFGKRQDSAGGFWNPSTADGISRGGQSSRSAQNNLFNKEGNSIYQGERSGPCTLSSSLYYGGQDICNHISDSHYSNSSYNFQQRSYTNNGEDNPSGSPIDSRGDWWQVALACAKQRCFLCGP